MIRLRSTKSQDDAYAQHLAHAVAATLRFMREQHEISQELLARQADIDRSCYARLEQGKRPISLLLVLKVAKGLGCPAASLVKAIEREFRQNLWMESLGAWAGKPEAREPLKLVRSQD